jgi:site-specific DNA-methyltransferase (adenine-specific)
MLEKNKLYLGDCLEVMKEIPDKSVDLILIDPPYNINKAEWDRFDTKNGYIDFMSKVFQELQRVLKDNGSFYFFHNDFMQIVELQNEINMHTNLIFKSIITWNKKFKGSKNEKFLQGYNEINGLRNYQKFVEYILFYTFQDDTGRKLVDHDVNNYKSLREYSKKIQDYIGLNKKQIISKIGQSVDHFFRWKSSQFSLPTEKTYNKLIEIYSIDTSPFFLKYEELRLKYEELRLKYEELRLKYEELRYTFNNQKTDHSVWEFEFDDKKNHVTEKPVNILENIIKYSSNENDVILDCFMGSGSTGVACKNLNRKFIGIEKDEKYFEIAKDRI